MIPLAKARSIASRIAAKLAPFCDRIEVAGSIRREKPFVGDIDLVCLPKPHHKERLIERALQNTTVICLGSDIVSLGLRDGTQVDLFFAHPEQRDLITVTPTNFGSILLCRTGSKEHNVKIASHARRINLQWRPFIGVVDLGGQVLASETEEQIFEALKMDFVDPLKREVE